MITLGKGHVTEIGLLALLLLGGGGCALTTSSDSGVQQVNAMQEIPSEPEVITTFHCVQESEGWATIARRGNLVTESPMIIWNTPEFGPEYTPSQRCQMVSGKLTKVVEENGGKLSGLHLKTGKVENGYTVVCHLNQNNSGQESCTLDNMLFTLNQENAENPNETLATILQFGKAKANTRPVYESSLPEKFSLLEVLEGEGVSWVEDSSL